MKRILLGVTGSYAAPKAAELAEKLTKNGYAVDAILTRAAQKFVQVARLETATRRIVYTDALLDDTPPEARYLMLAKDADLAVVAPATANTIAKIASGSADNLLTLTLLALEHTPVLLCPSMDAAVYRSPATQRNRRTLENDGYYFLGPRETENGKGPLAETDAIVAEIVDMLNPDLWGAYI